MASSAPSITIKASALDPECRPTPCVKSSMLAKMKTDKVPTKKVHVHGHGERNMYTVTFAGREALVDAITGSVYVNDVCLSSDVLYVDKT